MTVNHVPRQTSLHTLIGAALLACLVISSPAFAIPPPAEKRVALVVGNSEYHDGLLVSGVSDANEIKQALEDLHFDVISVANGELSTTTKALDDFGKRLSGATVAVVFYSGHGFHLSGQTYLQPVDGSVELKSTLPLDTVLQKLGLASNAVKLVFLDVCRTIENLPEGASQGLAEPEQTPGDVLQSFAASPGQTAASGAGSALSPYTTVLVRHIREAGLSIGDLLALIHAEVVSPDHSQSPTQAGPVPEDRTGPEPKPFCLRPAVIVDATINKADDGIVVLLRGDVVVNQRGSGSTPKKLALKAGLNRLEILVFNQKTFHNGQGWERTEGWDYSMSLRGPDGELTAADCQGKSPCFSDKEDVPFKDGPHHGGVFRVASADLHVDPVSGALQLQGVNTRLWDDEAPVWARQQDLLYDAPVKSLPLDQVQLFGNKVDILKTAQQILDAVKLFGPIKLPDLDKVFIGVRGNLAFKEFVRVCMIDRQSARIADLNQSLAAALAGNPTPFVGFDRALTQCVQEVAAQQPGNTLQPNDIAVWADLEDRSL
jgi:hypothetical protein